ncbi:divergent polysaccharide deacetylase family protein [Phaeobacter sp. QD34_3]|nr:divergent polysaccharide deacetylase family protein [Phaeobacter sp. QD34_3]MDE4131662.1 divergent polysaccharide deacetylase family protein [Phaeobacter sp. QD34_3]
MRGFLGGVSIGALVAACVAAMWSLSTPLPQQIDVSATGPSTGTAPAESGPAPMGTPQADADLVEAAPAALENAPSDDLSAIEPADTEPSERPEIGSAGTVEGTDSGAVPVVPEAPKELDTASGSEEPGALAQSATGEDPVDVSTATAPTPAPSVSSQTGAEPPQGDQQPVPGPEIAAQQPPVTDPGLSVSPSIAMPQLGSAPAPTAPPVIGITPPAPPSSTEETSAEEKMAEDAGMSEEDQESAKAEAQPEEGRANRIAALPTADAPDRAGTPRIGTPVVPLTERDEAADSLEENTAQTPFEANSEPFDLSDDRPLMSIVLIDDAQSVGAEALAEFPYPISFAIDPQDPRAAEKMAERRAAGFEVLILSDLPREAQPQDAETALAVWFDLLPQAVGVLEGVASGVQGNRPLADQVADAVRAGGYGLVLQNNGLNTVQKLALRDGVPAGVVFRDFDGAGQNPRAMRRFLDQAAFRAGQEGAVIMLGRLQPDTISALLLWGLQDRASRVALAPISASLRSNLAGTGQ